MDANSRTEIHVTENKRKLLSRLSATALGLFLGVSMQPAIAGPTGGEVVRGEAHIGQTGSTTAIQQQSHRLVLEWQAFNVGANEQVVFNQPGATSVALNRIFDQNASQILGAIDANGRVFLINPNGVIFGSTATVNVGSLVASSLDLGYDDFMAGNYAFQTAADGGPGVVVNRGLLQASTGGSVTLLGGGVSNEGLIVAELGQVTLAAGSGASLDFDGDGLLFFEVTGDVLDNGGLDSAASNSGEILAQGGQVLLTARAAKDVFSNVVNNDGLIRAQRIDNSGGVIRLVGSGGDVLTSGVLDASGAGETDTGGTVQVLGDRVAVYGDALVDVSGDSGGGRVHIGGGFQGSDPDVANASHTYVGANARIDADARSDGNGGDVVVWADDTTRYFGDISARGGVNGGNGGFVEVSGAQNLAFQGSVDLTASNGNGGVLLLDPQNIILNNTPQTAPPDNGDGVPDVAFADPPAGTLTIQIADVVGFSELYLQATNDIDVDDPLTMNANGSVFFEANNDIRVNAALEVSGTGSITLSADNDLSGLGAISVDAPVIADGGDINLTGSGITVADGADGAETIRNTGAGEINLTSTLATDISLGDFAISGGTGAITLFADGDVTAANATADEEIDAGGAVSLTGDNIGSGTNSIEIDGVTNLTLSTTGSFDVTGDNATTLTDLNITADGTTGANTYALNTFFGAVLAMTDSGTDLDLGVSNIAGNFSLRAISGGITDSGAVDIIGTSNFRASGALGGITLDTLQSDGAVTLFTGGNATVANNSALVLGTSIVFGDLDASTTVGTITDGGVVDVQGTSSFTANDAALVGLDGITLDTLASDGAVSLNTFGNATVVNNSALSIGASSVGGNLFARTTVGTITDSGAIDVGGTSSFTANNAALIGVDGIVLDTLESGGAVTLNTLGNATVASDSALIIGASSIGGNLLASTTLGSITDLGAVDVSGTSSFTANGTGGGIDLNSLRSNGALTLDTVGGATVINDSALVLNASTVGADLDVTALTGAITDNGALNVDGTSSFTANGAGGSIDLDTLQSNGAVSLNTIASATVVNDVGLNLGDSTVGIDLNATAATGDISSSGALIIAGNSTFTTNAAGRSISVDNGGNAFTGSVTFVGVGGLTNVSVADNTALELQSGLSLAGDLTVTAAGITEAAGGIAVGGNSTFNAGANAITLNDGANDFTGTVSLNNNGTNGIVITDSNDLVLGLSTIGGDLTAAATTGTITDGGAVDVTGTSSFTATGAGGGINLDTLEANAAVTLNTVGDATVVNGSALVLAASTVDGNLDVTATAGAITDNGAVNVAGTSSFTASAGNINLDSLQSDGAVALNTVANATVVNDSALNLAASTIGGNLVAAATAGAITDSGALDVTGTSSFTTNGGADITLDMLQADGAVALNTAGNATIVNNLALVLGTSTVGGDLDVTASAGDITDLGILLNTVSGNLNVAGAATFNVADGQSILLDSGANVFNGAVNFTSVGQLNNVTVVDTTDLQIQSGLSLTGDLSVVASGITQAAGGIAVVGNSSFDARANAITLNDGGNDFTGAVSLNNSGANAVAIRDVNGLELGASAVGSGTLTVTAEGITQSGKIVQQASAGQATFDGGGAAIDLPNAENDFTGAVLLNTTASALVKDANDLNMGTSTTSGDLDATAINSLNLSGILTSQNGTVILTAENGDILNASAGAEVRGQAAILEALAGNIGTLGDSITIFVPRVEGQATITLRSSTKPNISNENSAIIDSAAGVNDAVAVVISNAVGASVISAVEEIGFVDWAGLDPDVRLVDCLEPCIKLPADQLEDEGLAWLREPTQMLMIRTVDGVRLIPIYREPIAQNSVGADGDY